MEKNLVVDPPKLFATIALGAYFLFCVQDPLGWHFIDNVDLIIHEAGHTIFFAFGQFIHILGGSLFQIIVPLIFVLYFYARSDPYSTSLMVTWIGYNLVNISVYINDAIDMKLPLLGGDDVIHDWNYILSSTNLLDKTHNLAGLANGMGVTLVIISIVSALYYSRRKI